MHVRPEQSGPGALSGEHPPASWLTLQMQFANRASSIEKEKFDGQAAHGELVVDELRRGLEAPRATPSRRPRQPETDGTEPVDEAVRASPHAANSALESGQ
jgi:hypothetical protein